MPQLSPMSWVLVFAILLICVILFMVSVWWGVVGEYKFTVKDKLDGGVSRSLIKWGFSKK
uniref:ATP synthase F0 subunit 8 n=1 Tax=Toxolasma parvum TaxID=227614 RepID=F4ZGD7_TOXPA|nr:ATP synthase F0 subunit 8 [Toxolasma parvum]ADL62646.1 ATP synthase F0 subunit 8 [Toxolasma parvum]